MQKAATDRQLFRARLQVNRCTVGIAAHHMADRAQIDHDRAVDLGKVLRVELRDQWRSGRVSGCLDPAAAAFGQMN